MWLRCEDETLLNVNDIKRLYCQRSISFALQSVNEPDDKKFYVEAMTSDRGYVVARVDTETEGRAILVGIRQAIEKGEATVIDGPALLTTD